MKRARSTRIESSSPARVARGRMVAFERAACALMFATSMAVSVAASAQMQPGSNAAMDVPDNDDATARAAWMRERFGDVHSPHDQQTLLAERQRESTQRTRQPASAGAARWISIGPSGDDYIQNGSVTLVGAIDSGRVRTILVDPLDPSGDSLYVLTSAAAFGAAFMPRMRRSGSR